MVPQRGSLAAANRDLKRQRSTDGGIPENRSGAIVERRAIELTLEFCCKESIDADRDDLKRSQRRDSGDLG